MKGKFKVGSGIGLVVLLATCMFTAHAGNAKKSESSGSCDPAKVRQEFQKDGSLHLYTVDGSAPEVTVSKEHLEMLTSLNNFLSDKEYRAKAFAGKSLGEGEEDEAIDSAKKVYRALVGRNFDDVMRMPRGGVACTACNKPEKNQKSGSVLYPCYICSASGSGLGSGSGADQE